MFADTDIKRLRLFFSRAEKLRASATGLMKNLSLEMSYKANEPFRTRFDGPDLHDVKAALLDLRPFILQGEPTHFFSICNILYTNTADDAVAARVAQFREAWAKLVQKNGPPPGGMSMKVNDRELSACDITDMWLNGEFFHADIEKVGLLESLHATPMGKMTYLSFIDLVQKQTSLVLWLSADVVSRMLGEADGK